MLYGTQAGLGQAPPTWLGEWSTAGGETTWYEINAAMAPQGAETTSMTMEYGGVLKLIALLRAYVDALRAQNQPLPPGRALLQGDSDLVVKQVAGLRAVADA